MRAKTMDGCEIDLKQETLDGAQEVPGVRREDAGGSESMGCHAPSTAAAVSVRDCPRHYVRAAYGSNHDRLIRIKNKYDPKNLFRMNQNIKPFI